MVNQTIQALTIAGTDSGGGAGIMADIKTMEACHVFSAAIVVAVTAQNTLGVQDFTTIPTKIINEQFTSINSDFKIRACKTGMLANPLVVNTVADNLKKYNFGPLIVDPVIVAKGGSVLLSQKAVITLKEKLLPLATVVTPNLPEAEKLSGIKINNQEKVLLAAKKLRKLGTKNIIIKGGHTKEKTSSDFVLLENGKSFWMSSPRINTKRTHGTGDTLSSCITAEIAKGNNVETAIKIGKKYIQATIEQGIQVGHGHGPLNHWAKI